MAEAYLVGVFEVDTDGDTAGETADREVEFGLTDVALVALGIPWFLIAAVGPNHNMMYAAFFAAPIFVALHAVSLARYFGLVGNRAGRVETEHAGATVSRASASVRVAS